MTKRDLVKWLELEKESARKIATERRDKMIQDARGKVYDVIKMDQFEQELQESFAQILKSFDNFFYRCSEIKGISTSKFHWKLSYNEFEHYHYDPKHLHAMVQEIVKIDTEDYNKARREAISYYNNVEKTYDDVIQTVKNLPSAKAGIEYLTKLGFDVSKILPAEPVKQLPATIGINVDTKYLIFDKK